MTCRDFRRTATSLTLWELSRSGDKQLLEHAGTCARCGAWLENQQMLAGSMQALQAHTAGREAGPHVERTLLRAFRQETLKRTEPVAAFRSAPSAFRLGRFLQWGAYAAVAAAIAVGMFLGARLLERPSAVSSQQSAGSNQQSAISATAPMQSRSAAAVSTAPVQQAQTVGTATQPPEAVSSKREVAAHPVSQRGSTQRPSVAAASQTSDDADYVALMFCDPLICSSEAQVVRMELPVAGATDHDAQTQVADVIVGDDGLVRAMRIVN